MSSRTAQTGRDLTTTRKRPPHRCAPPKTVRIRTALILSRTPERFTSPAKFVPAMRFPSMAFWLNEDFFIHRFPQSRSHRFRKTKSEKFCAFGGQTLPFADLPEGFPRRQNSPRHPRPLPRDPGMNFAGEVN